MVKLLFILLSLSIPVDAQHVSTSPVKVFSRSLSDWGKLTPLERHKRGVDGDIKSRKISLNVIKQTDGIKSGLVIAYGHVIQPPYKVYIENKGIMVNGVQVSPSLIWQREVPKYSGKVPLGTEAKLQSAMAVSKKAHEIFCEFRITKAKEEVAAEILNFVKNSTETVLDAYWTDESRKDSLRIKWIDGVGSDSIDFPRSSCQNFITKLRSLLLPGEKNPEARHKQALGDYARGIIKRLNMGQIIVFASHGEGELRWDRRDEVNKIMGMKELNEIEKVEALNKLGFGYGGALDIIENHNSSEWKVQGPN